jgi:hypothetical protein
LFFGVTLTAYPNIPNHHGLSERISGDFHILWLHNGSRVNNFNEFWCRPSLSWQFGEMMIDPTFRQTWTHVMLEIAMVHTHI